MYEKTLSKRVPIISQWKWIRNSLKFYISWGMWRWIVNVGWKFYWKPIADNCNESKIITFLNSWDICSIFEWEGRITNLRFSLINLSIQILNPSHGFIITNPAQIYLSCRQIRSKRSINPIFTEYLIHGITVAKTIIKGGDQMSDLTVFGLEWFRW